MNKCSIILFFFILLKTGVALACDCNWGGNFIESSKYEDLIVKAKVVNKTYQTKNGERFFDQEDAMEKWEIDYSSEPYAMGASITIEIIQVIRGKESRKMIEIFGSDGADCREILDYFEIGAFYILNIYKPDTSMQKLPNESVGDYAMSGCSENWLQYLPKTKKVYGYINVMNAQSIFEMEKIYLGYKKLKKRIKQYNANQLGRKL